MFEKTFEWTSVFIGLIQRTRYDFYRRPKKTTFLTNFLSNGHLAHTIRFFFRSYCAERLEWMIYCWRTRSDTFIAGK